MEVQSLKELHFKYIDENLVPEIISKLENETLIGAEKEYSGGLDGFMSALYNIKLKTTLNEESTIKERLLIVKFMKGDNAFRESSKSYIQFANEIFIYEKVWPAYANLLKEAKINLLNVEDWVAHCYVAKFGFIEGLSATPTTRESVLVLDNLKPRGYTLGPRVYLNKDHLLAMAKPLGQYHALSYALRIHNEPQFEKLRKQITPLPFINIDDPDDAKRNLYAVLYRVAFDRFFDYFDRMVNKQTFDKQKPEDLKLIENVSRLREKYFEQPTMLLERLRTSIEENESDRSFGAILHGDYNRNNVLFRYVESEGKTKHSGEDIGQVADVKLIDFQELRYGTLAIDLSFFMYFNSSEAVRADAWSKILKTYHEQMYNTLDTVMRGLQAQQSKAEIEKLLEPYSFDKFNDHFSHYAFYGVMICLHFLPWVLCSQEECSRLSELFESDMHGDEFYKISMTAGGDEVNQQILNVVKHASIMGYMDHI